jgi:hypothetical protein
MKRRLSTDGWGRHYHTYIKYRGTKDQNTIHIKMRLYFVPHVRHEEFDVMVPKNKIANFLQSAVHVP